jgi:hypothetical protein
MMLKEMNNALESAALIRAAHLSPTDAEKIGRKIGPTAGRQSIEERPTWRKPRQKRRIEREVCRTETARRC